MLYKLNGSCCCSTRFVLYRGTGGYQLAYLRLVFPNRKQMSDILVSDNVYLSLKTGQEKEYPVYMGGIIKGRYCIEDIHIYIYINICDLARV